MTLTPYTQTAHSAPTGSGNLLGLFIVAIVFKADQLELDNLSGGLSRGRLVFPLPAVIDFSSSSWSEAVYIFPCVN